MTTWQERGEPVEMDFKDMQVLHREALVYPPMARLVGFQGDVVVRMIIDEHGLPTAVSMISGPPQFQAAALRAARRWRFRPVRVNGQAVQAAFNFTLQFRLNPEIP
jgi:protein TonB